jgi:SAM-dependent methyltransferase
VRAVRLFAEYVMEECAVGVVSVGQALIETQRAFDGVAAAYDQSNTENRTLCDMRARVRQTVESAVPAGAHLLDLGCGPGTDLIHFATAGYRVTGIDWSPSMVREAQGRIDVAGAASRSDALHLGIHEIDRLPPSRFDAAYSNFGPLNCVPDLPAAAQLIADRLHKGGAFVASVIGRICPWEVGFYLARGRWSRAAIRFREGLVPVPLEGGRVWTRYYTPRAFERVFAAAGFTRVSLRALGLFAPPPYLHAFAGRHPAVVGALQRLDDRVGAWPGVRACGDHFLIVLRKA